MPLRMRPLPFVKDPVKRNQGDDIQVDIHFRLIEGSVQAYTAVDRQQRYLRTFMCGMVL